MTDERDAFAAVAAASMLQLLQPCKKMIEKESLVRIQEFHFSFRVNILHVVATARLLGQALEMHLTE